MWGWKHLAKSHEDKVPRSVKEEPTTSTSRQSKYLSRTFLQRIKKFLHVHHYNATSGVKRRPVEVCARIETDQIQELA